MVPLPADHVDAFGQGGIGKEGVAHAPGDEKAGGIREDLDTSTDFTDGRSRFEDCYGVACERDSDCSGKATQTSTDDDNLRV